MPHLTSLTSPELGLQTGAEALAPPTAWFLAGGPRGEPEKHGAWEAPFVTVCPVHTHDLLVFTVCPQKHVLISGLGGICRNEPSLWNELWGRALSLQAGHVAAGCSHAPGSGGAALPQPGAGQWAQLTRMGQHVAPSGRLGPGTRLLCGEHVLPGQTTPSQPTSFLTRTWVPIRVAQPLEPNKDRVELSEDH